MNKVGPLRDKQKLEKMKQILHYTNLRDYACFIMGIECGLKISDLVLLNISDVMKPNKKIRDTIDIAKGHGFTVSNGAAAALEAYLLTRGAYEYTEPLFRSRKRKQGAAAAVSRISVYRTINAAAKAAGIDEQVGTESMRKTFAYLAIERGESLAYVSKILHHPSKRETLKYLGIYEEQIRMY